MTPLSVRHPADREHVPLLRKAARDYAQGLGLSREQVSAVALAVTEAATNAVLHAYIDREPGEVELFAEPGKDQLVVRVRDDGRGMKPRFDSPGIGLGLPTIGSLCAHLDIAHGPDGTGTEVRMAFHAPGLEPAAERSPEASAWADRLQRILGALSEAVTVTDANGRMLYANRAAAELLGASSAEEVLSAPAGELTSRFHITLEDGSPVSYDDLPHRRVLAGEAPRSLLTRSVHLPTGRAMWLLTTSTLLEDEEVEQPLAVNTIRDVTAAKNAERRQRFLADAGDQLAQSLDLGETFERIARLAVPALADWCAVDLMGADGDILRAAMAHTDPEKLAFGRELNRRYPPTMDDEGGVAAVLRSGEPEFVRELTDEMLHAGIEDDEYRELLRTVGMRSIILAPMAARGRTLGVLTLVTADSGRLFSEEDVDLALEVARRAAVAVDNARLFASRE